MIAVVDVLMIFAGGFITSTVCNYIHRLQYLMGHSEIATTLNIYTHVNAEQVKSEMKKLENIM